MLSYEESLKILKETKALIDGHFILSSGLHSPKYVQCAQLLSKPKKASQICKSLENLKSKEKNYTSTIIVDLPHKPGALGNISSLIGINKGLSLIHI